MASKRSGSRRLGPNRSPVLLIGLCLMIVSMGVTTLYTYQLSHALAAAEYASLQPLPLKAPTPKPVPPPTRFDRSTQAVTAAEMALQSGKALSSPLTGADALGDWTTDAPGVRRRLTMRELPPPYATEIADNVARRVDRPSSAWPRVPAGFEVTQFAKGLIKPRVIVTAPNGDLLVVESERNRLILLRDADGDGRPELQQTFANELSEPYGMAFLPPGPNPRYLYVANTNSVVRFPYRNGDLRARAAPETVVEILPAGGKLKGGGHWTRNLVFSPDGAKMYVSVGSFTNVWEEESADESGRAAIHEYNADGSGFRLYATGIRNPVGLAVHPQTGELWCSVNERDGLGDHLPFDYVTRVQEGGFYGWPWYYMGQKQDPRHSGKMPELRAKTLTPDVLLQAHSAALNLTFYTGEQFPTEYRNEAFLALHGSWNRARRTGYKLVRLRLRDGQPTGEYEDFMTGFVSPDGNVWGRPVGVTVSKAGELLVTDDAGGCIWRIAYTGQK